MLADSRHSPESLQALRDYLVRLRLELPASLQSEFDFELDLFLSRMDLLESRASGPERPGVGPRSDYQQVRRDLYNFLKDDLVYFLQKLLAGRYEPPAGFPGMPDLSRDISDILRELGVYVQPAARDFSRSSILERWYADLIQDGPLQARAVIQYFTIYRSRLYSLDENRPYLFENARGLVRHLIRSHTEPGYGDRADTAQSRQASRSDGLSFEQIYRAEIKLRDEIQMALLRRQALQRHERPHRDYLVAREMVLELSDLFVTQLHHEFERYYEERLRTQADLHTQILEEKHHLDAELRQAAHFQGRFIQKELPADDSRLKFALWYEPFSTVGGDYYRVVRLEDDVYGVFVADITGHGISAAMHFNTVVNSFEKCESYFDRPDKLLRKMNESLYGQLGDHFLTAIYVRLDLKKRTLDYCNAGHPKGFLAALGDRRRVRFLRPNGKILGAFRKAEFRRQSLPLYDRCRLILYTDGISETIRKPYDENDYHLLGERGLLDLFDARTTLWDSETTLRHIQGRVHEFQGDGARIEDDRTLLITDIRCSEAERESSGETEAS